VAQQVSEDSRPSWLATIDERWPGARRRAAGIGLAVLLELGLLALLLTLGQSLSPPRSAGESLTTVDFAPDAPRPEPARVPEQPARPSALPPVERSLPDVAPPVPEPVPTDAPQPTPAIRLPSAPPATPVAGKARAVIRDDMGGPIGPAYTPSPGDSERIAGSGPNGEPLYRARWYREPTDQELRGYLSTAGGPGWALINCRTVPDFRVQDCVLVDQYPDNGQMGRAVLAAAWQFRVRPPQVGGRPLVGEWVRIRISLEMTKR
jgi:periplasmic protein TonB